MVKQFTLSHTMAMLTGSRIDFLTLNLKLEAAHLGCRELGWKDPLKPQGPPDGHCPTGLQGENPLVSPPILCD